MERRLKSSLLAIAVTAMLVIAGCSDGDEDSKTKTVTSSEAATFVGKVEGTGANIGLVTKNGKVAGFVCENKTNSLRLDPVPIKNGTAKLIQDGRTVGAVEITDHGAAGKVEIAGLRHIFSAEHATGQAGVYRSANQDAEEDWDGWVVLNDGSYTGTSKSKPSTGKPWVDPEVDP